MSLTTELEKELQIYSLMKDLNVTQVLFTQQVTTLTSFSKSGAREPSAWGGSYKGLHRDIQWPSGHFVLPIC